MHKYFSENWYQATEKFQRATAPFGGPMWCVAQSGTQYDIPYISIGSGDNVVVINSGVHGIEGYFGSAAQNMFLNDFVPYLGEQILRKYRICVVHVINGWGMQHRMREVMDTTRGGLVDLNRNFGVDFAHPENLPKNPKYAIAHPVLLSVPDAIGKKNMIHDFWRRHRHDGVWDAISYGQYYEPYGLFYGGAAPMIESQMAMSIYEKLCRGAKSVVSIGLHTGLGRYWRRERKTTAHLLVSHPSSHKNTQYFQRVFAPAVRVVPDENAAHGPTLLGDMVDWIETRFAKHNVPVYTADFEIGTGEYPIMSPIYKRMDMGDARYDLLHDGRINDTTWDNLTESWYPSDAGWRESALNNARILFRQLVQEMQRASK